MGGLIVLPGSMFVLHVLKVDDPVDAVTVSTAWGNTALHCMLLLLCQALCGQNFDVQLLSHKVVHLGRRRSRVGPPGTGLLLVLRVFIRDMHDHNDAVYRLLPCCCFLLV